MTEGNGSSAGQQLEKLTKTIRNGEVLVRSAAVDAEIHAALRLNASEVRRRATLQDSKDPEALSSECLVYLLRDAHRRGDESQVYALWSILAGRISPRVESALRTLGTVHTEDGVSNVLGAVGLAILDLDGDRGDFFQVKFSVAIKRRAIDEFWRQLRLAKKDRKLTSLAALPGEEGHLPAELDDETDAPRAEDWASDSNTALEELEQQELDAETEARIEAVLAMLPNRVRQAFILRVKEGWQIESNAPNEMTIARALDRSPRQIRNYLKEAETRLRKWREGAQ